MTAHVTNSNQISQLDEQQLVLPTRTLVVTLAAITLILAGAWSLLVTIGPWDIGSIQAGLAGIAIVAVISLASLLVISPWKKRSISFWMTLWLGGTVFRLLLTPAVLLLLYYVASFDGTSHLVVAGICYVLTLFSEATILALYFKSNLVD